MPILAIAFQQVTLRLSLAWSLDFGAIPGFVKADADAVISLTIALIVFTFSSLLVAIQVASAQLTPRIIATTLLRDRVIRSTVGVFVYTMGLAVGVKARTEVPQFLVGLTGIMALVCVIAFLFLIDYTARLMRPVSIVWRIAEQGLKVIDAMYPNPHESRAASLRPAEPIGPAERTVHHRGRSGIVLAVNLHGLVTVARKTESIIEVAPQVGDFVAVGDPLFLLCGGATLIDDRTLRDQIAIERELHARKPAMLAFAPGCLTIRRRI